MKKPVEKHIYTVHEGHKDCKCESCGKSFSDEQSLKKHILIAHDNKIIKRTESESLQLEKFKCETCKKNFTTKYNLKVHTENVHEGLKKYKCDNCGKQFTQNNDLTVHEKIKRFNCDKCGKQFSKKFTLKMHIQTVH